MRALLKGAFGIIAGLAVVCILCAIVLSLIWSSITVYIEPGNMGVMIKKTGAALGPGRWEMSVAPPAGYYHVQVSGLYGGPDAPAVRGRVFRRAFSGARRAICRKAP